MKRILVVDDEPSITTLLKYNLEKEDFSVDVAYDGVEAVELATSQPYDFIILDLMLPKLSGFDVTKKLRAEKIATPILMLTAKDDVVDKIIGLEIGADDYLTKPFSPRELVARIRAVERRMTPYVDDSSKKAQLHDKLTERIKVGDLTAYPDSYRILKHGQELALTKKEFELLIYFMRRMNRIIDRDELMLALWQDDNYYQSRTVDIHISHLREKIEDNPKNPKYLLTVRGFGYKFQEPVNNEKEA
ncbi:response regulator transcription factor [Vagococcus acidifermentans]|uniref:DNA-binding response regulator n=1 Tax=Vagococcus acidifermentans TaxID=564710 RepID=A0A430AVI3_9ENTE|nr:response regulator transcription factor [Vagococcus acidifermentans]RSU12059.1 DNA-binding response regulator [Vagococcus acidifermentans]